MKMVNMKMGKGESNTLLGESPSKDSPAYPYGLNIELNEDSLKKLKLDDLPEAGEEMYIHAKVSVVRSSITDTKEGGKQRSVSLQITDLCLGEEKDETAEKMYG
jgi:hypothetical protein